MRGMRQACWVIQIIPKIRFGETTAFRQLNPACKIVVGIHVARQGLKTRNQEWNDQPDDEENGIMTPAHRYSPIRSNNVRGERRTHQRIQYRPRIAAMGGKTEIRSSTSGSYTYTTR